MALNVKQRPKKRRLAVIEQPVGVAVDGGEQLIWATPNELEMYRKSFPYLVIRWAEQADKAKWRFAPELFDQKELKEEFLG